ncbi:chemotaxis protein CheY [Pseudomonas fluorescens]|uniref:chemotaxis protein CheY n=1 Tax=Pseudomonas fluorescens TaxID=294 RepID=UPI001BE7A042|nr:chemotaxis protein CheY [Pseudomonas fluorescens]MBT2374481.1 response regulator transcription factor [Pseudomonas fluorescens]
MPDKALTILIADEQHLPRLHIEKILNQLGYYRIVPVQTFEEVLILTALPAEPFDVLIFNAGLVTGDDEVAAFQQQHPQIRHVLVYDDLEWSTAAVATHSLIVRSPGAPDSVNLEHVMGIIDPSPPATGLRVLPWLRELSRSRAH